MRALGVVVLLGGCVDASFDERASAIQNGVATDRAPVAGLRYTGTFQGTPVDKIGCTATLIAPDVLVTAAHCIDPAITDMVGLPRVAFEADATAAAGLAVSRVVVHEAFVYSTPFHIYLENPHDVGLLFLAAGAGVTPATISRDAVTIGTDLEIVGYGQRTVDDDGTLGLEHVAAMSVTEIGASEVRAISNRTPQECVAEGDSGGPALIGTRVIGLTSHSGGETFDCVHGDIFERIDTHVDWIIEQAPSVCMHSDICEDPVDPVPPPGDDGGCNTGHSGGAWLALLALFSLGARRRR